MSEQREHINQYSAKDIQRYLKGELSPSEMHAMEKAALDDPFLADAIEGMEETMNAHGEPLINANLESIQQQVQNRIENKKSRIIAIRWWYAAAAVVLITGSIWIYNGSLNRSSKDSVALLAKKNQSKADSAAYYNKETLPLAEKNEVANADVVKDSLDLKAVAKIKNSSSFKKNGRQLSFRKKGNYQFKLTDSLTSNLYISSGTVETKKDTGLGAALSFSTSEDRSTRSEALEKIPGRFDGLRFDSIETETVHVKPAPKVAARYQDDKTKLRNVISGRVVDQFYHPLSNANVISLDNRVLLNTDQYGLFKMPTSDSSVNVTVSLSGYNTQNVTLQNNAALNNIQLQPLQNQEQTNQSRKSGDIEELYKSKRSSSENNLVSFTHQDAQPVYGWVNFEQYLIKNKKPPPDNPNLKGQVVVSFIVNKRTGLSDFKIEQHLAKGYDEEAIRLVKEGPQWKLLKGRKTKVLVVVHF